MHSFYIKSALFSFRIKSFADYCFLSCYQVIPVLDSLQMTESIEECARTMANYITNCARTGETFEAKT